MRRITIAIIKSYCTFGFYFNICWFELGILLFDDIILLTHFNLLIGHWLMIIWIGSLVTLRFMYDNQLVILSPISVILCKILIAVFTKSTKIDQLTSSNLNQIGLCVRRIQSRISYMTITIRCKSKRTAHKNRSTKTNTNQTLLAYECAWENMIFFERW